MHDLKQQFPLTAVSVYLVPPQEHSQFILRQTVDIAFGLYTAEGVAPHAANLAPVSMRLVASPQHPLSRLPSVNRDDLAQYTQVCLTHIQTYKDTTIGEERPLGEREAFAADTLGVENPEQPGIKKPPVASWRFSRTFTY